MVQLGIQDLTSHSNVIMMHICYNANGGYDVHIICSLASPHADNATQIYHLFSEIMPFKNVAPPAFTKIMNQQKICLSITINKINVSDSRSNIMNAMFFSILR